MATDGKIIHVFLASPGDVGEERAFVRWYLESMLPRSPLVAHRLVFDVVAWDHPASTVPMPAHLSPREAVIRFKRAPAGCDIVIVILWGRLGTHLDPAALSRPDGSRYLSGTEWEYENAFNASPRPDILVYRRADPVLINARDPARAEKQEQADRVEQFVGRFKNTDGSWKGGYSEYEGMAGFAKVLANDLEHLVAERLKAAPVTPPELASRPSDSSVASIPLPDRCFGRDEDTAAVVATLVSTDPHIAVLVQGPGGIGKTTLTQQAANDDSVVARFGARRWFVELETATDRDTFDAAILLALGLDATQGFDAALNRLAQDVRRVCYAPAARVGHESVTYPSWPSPDLIGDQPGHLSPHVRSPDHPWDGGDIGVGGWSVRGPRVAAFVSGRSSRAARAYSAIRACHA